MNPDSAAPNPVRTLLTIPHPINTSHNGGALTFGPNDGYLYIALGDGGGRHDPNGNGQNSDTLLGSILRIDVDRDAFPADPARNYANPPDNPFVGSAGCRRNLGLRAPQPLAYQLRSERRPLYRRRRRDCARGGELPARFVPWRGQLRLGISPKALSAPPLRARFRRSSSMAATLAGRSSAATSTGARWRRGRAATSSPTSFPAQSGRCSVVNGVASEVTERTAQIASPEAPLSQITSFGLDRSGELYVVTLPGDVFRLEAFHAPADGNNSLRGGPGNDRIFGGPGNDVLRGDGGRDTLNGEEGNDLLFGGPNPDRLSGGAGADSLHGNGGRDVLRGGPGNDGLRGGGDPDDLFGDQGDDLLLGGPGLDQLSGGAGANSLHGNGGRDVLRGGPGDDGLRGGGDPDRLFGGEGDDLLLGGPGLDRLSGGRGANSLHGNGGRDVLNGGAGNDGLRGGGDPDNLFGDYGDDLLLGGPGRDQLSGGAGADSLHGNGGRDMLRGGAGNDALQGGGDPDTLFGDQGDDLLIGGPGRDRFVFHPGGDNDLIRDFGDGDRLDLTALDVPRFRALPIPAQRFGDPGRPRRLRRRQHPT